jgi:hypothetical protein
MLATLLLTLLTTSPSAPQDKKVDDKGVAPKIDILVDDATYKKSEAKEHELAGKLIRSTAVEAGHARFYSVEAIVYVPRTVEREVNGKKVTTTELVPETRTQLIYVGNKDDALQAYAGKTVKLTGKALETVVGSKTINTFWPGRLELWDPKAKVEDDEGCCIDEKDAPLKIYAKAHWHYADMSPRADNNGKQFVIRSAADLLANMNIGRTPDGTDDERVAAVAKQLKVGSIDWKKQMLIVVTGGVKESGGWKIDIAAVTRGEKACTVSWSLEAPQGVTPHAVTHPAVMALVDRCEGEGTVNFLKTAVQIKPALPK